MYLWTSIPNEDSDQQAQLHSLSSLSWINLGSLATQRTPSKDLQQMCRLILSVHWVHTVFILCLITAHTHISAQSSNAVVFRLQPVYFLSTL